MSKTGARTKLCAPWDVNTLENAMGRDQELMQLPADGNSPRRTRRGGNHSLGSRDLHRGREQCPLLGSTWPTWPALTRPQGSAGEHLQLGFSKQHPKLCHLQTARPAQAWLPARAISGPQDSRPRTLVL